MFMMSPLNSSTEDTECLADVGHRSEEFVENM